MEPISPFSRTSPREGVRGEGTVPLLCFADIVGELGLPSHSFEKYLIAAIVAEVAKQGTRQVKKYRAKGKKRKSSNRKAEPSFYSI